MIFYVSTFLFLMWKWTFLDDDLLTPTNDETTLGYDEVLPLLSRELFGEASSLRHPACH
jgi:hypothetical protein